ncbi:MAG TPA: ATP-grasp domain-containing protein [Chloroflexota bacterium]|nr:ATP-grasp domain-containing protein [Chloroflexota bacterium]
MRTRTYRAKAFLQAAERVGVDVTVATEREQPLASLAPGTTLALDFRSEKRACATLREFVERYPVDTVVGVDDDTTVLAAQLSAALGLPHNPVEAVKAARYKDVMRLALGEAPGLLSPAFWILGTDADPRRFAASVPYPCVLKPLSLAASRGVIRADNARQFVDAFDEIVAILAETDLDPADPGASQLLVEEFIPGREVALEGLLIDGVLTTLALFDKPDPLDGPYFEETIYVTPSRLPRATQALISATAQRAAAALGLCSGPVHAELRLNERGAWIVEVAARSIGGLCSSMLRFGEEHTTSLEEIILRQAAQLDLASLAREQRPAGTMMIPIPATGRLIEVRGLAEAKAVAGIDEITISIPCGEQVVPLPRATRYLGFIFAHGDAPGAVERSLRQAHSLLTFDIQ